MNISGYDQFKGQPIKLVSSCVRNPAGQLVKQPAWTATYDHPRDGDLVLVRCLSSTGAYNHVEDLSGMAVRVYEGDLLLLVLATRRSGTNLIGEVPAHALSAGDNLALVAQGGLAARCISVPASTMPALPLEVVAFPTDGGGQVLNLDRMPLVAPRTGAVAAPHAFTLFVCGTSAEVGKTTAVCNLNLALKKRMPHLRTAAIKACGTGRARDSLNYRAANYDVVVDFVDAGLASTYGTPRAKFDEVLYALLHHCHERADCTVVEVGGDFLEAQAPAALQAMAEMGAHCVMVVNDAMGALEGMRRLQTLAREPLMVMTFKQNLQALALRLGLPLERVADSADYKALDRLIGYLRLDERAAAASHA